MMNDDWVQQHLSFSFFLIYIYYIVHTALTAKLNLGQLHVFLSGVGDDPLIACGAEVLVGDLLHCVD